MRKHESNLKNGESDSTTHSRRTLLRRSIAGSAALAFGISSFESVTAKSTNDPPSEQPESHFSVQTLPNPEPDESDRFGSEIQISTNGQTALIGAHAEKGNVGQAYVFRRTASGWSHTSTLTDPEPEHNFFGTEVALSANGHTALLSAREVETGTVYVFRRTASGWSHTSTLSHPESDVDVSFGDAVELTASGQTALISAPNEYIEDTIEGQGKAYEFNLIGEEWTHTNTIRSPKDYNIGFLMSSMALSANGQTLFIGATDYDEAFIGKVYIFERSSSGWKQVEVLSNPEPTRWDFFSDSMALSANGRTALVAAPYDSTSDWGDTGRAYIFRRTASGWSHESTLPNPEPDYGDQFGMEVALSANGHTALLGAPSDDTGDKADTGKAYIFRRTTSGWSLASTLPNPQPYEEDGFGDTVDMSANGRTFMVSSDTPDKTDNGEVSIFNMSRPPRRSPGGSQS